ncbi:hypothetical protein K503DRAFT_517720 [Rhizopogon vinicolor AM-OR11-026]|uniref:Uncharacterized protein n=1 Tax=Rhizopogon vinicolor AM-OR11-026 TaxID=1314800 RepID=A0A1B7MLP5_9AGAM|nr:hypothetical protein K503DRAFT_517720 [Rhizopogon vinicolor AM-OR11-026]
MVAKKASAGSSAASREQCHPSFWQGDSGPAIFRIAPCCRHFVYQSCFYFRNLPIDILAPRCSDTSRWTLELLASAWHLFFISPTVHDSASRIPAFFGTAIALRA